MHQCACHPPHQAHRDRLLGIYSHRVKTKNHIPNNHESLNTMTGKDFVDLVCDNFLGLLYTVCSKQSEDTVEERSASVNVITMVTVFPKLLG